MSRVFLLSSNVSTEPYPVYPLGMAVVAGALAGSGHQVRQFDFLAEERSEQRLTEAVREFAPDFVCLSLRNIDNVDSLCAEGGWYLEQARRLVACLRTETAVPVILGGPAFSILPEEILDFVGGDHGIVGEGERAACELIDALAAGKAAGRIIAGGAPLAGGEMTAPLLEEKLVDFYLRGSGMLNLQTKRGCPHACAYCTYPHLEGKDFRPRDPREVADDLERMTREHGVDHVFFTDSVFNDPRGHYLEVAEELIRRELKLNWCGYFRPQGLGRAELALLKRSGLSAVELGTDAACDRTLAGLDKGFSFAEVLEVNRACLEEKVPCAHFVIFGGPGETTETLQEGLENMERLGPAVVFAFSGIRILQGAPIHQRAVADGVIAPDAPLLRPVYYFSPGVDSEQMNAAIEAAFAGRRDRIFPPSEGQARLSVMQRFGYRGLLWDKLISFDKGSRRRAGGA
ncbi:MAG: lipid biosynthesis B12-binding/radical SAM protein [Desulfuromonas sp.]|uniref:lipid biosynthesis B12-binding/radical SAM protein n=1 Tax=Desulfuromonas sp. TaxID=892 RepID=UPI000CAE1A93|nr:lipid biosynthesis B12-binding/radical SAM protein [Desulfuromonas sp.]PLX85240.1 MAG: lipid biosynthesis B12-binding/radical SAM protein [Desulfuromonas sp.]